MATKKKTAGEKQTPRPSPRSEAYDNALRDYGAALELLHNGDPAAALARFEAIAAENPDEPELTERVRAFAAVCTRKMATRVELPTDADGFYNAAVVAANDGRLDQALDLLNKAMELDAESPEVLYARASVFALRGQPDSAVADLKRAVDREPRLRFQAANDPDFERIRDEAAFIDVIEPTPAGA